MEGPSTLYAHNASIFGPTKGPRFTAMLIVSLPPQPGSTHNRTANALILLYSLQEEPPSLSLIIDANFKLQRLQNEKHFLTAISIIIAPRHTPLALCNLWIFWESRRVPCLALWFHRSAALYFEVFEPRSLVGFAVTAAHRGDSCF